ncbi:hypothetical protein [Streptacidiphilus rugosus]|uniref:hypothetical protein n=1 Tax=Streptacidiphilus rugosus TaxID=405783 RepID=UPI00055A0F8C|nr:hypothetical protein [Streptacidiphilus rugosus]
MARITRTRTEDISIEAFRLDLDEGERKALRADPGGYLRKLMENEGYTVNGIFVDAKFGSQDCEDWEVVHFLSGVQASHCGVMCIQVM